jgi:hypothetical protein
MGAGRSGSGFPRRFSSSASWGHVFVGAKTACDGSPEFWYVPWYGSDLNNPQCLRGLVRMYGSGRVKGGQAESIKDERGKRGRGGGKL